MSVFQTLGQERACRTLQGLLTSSRIPSALLLCGLEGTGKTRLAHEFAQALLCPSKSGPGAAACRLCADCLAAEKRLHPDIKAVNAAYQASLREDEEAKQKT